MKQTILAFLFVTSTALFAQKNVNYFDSGYVLLKQNNYQAAIQQFSLYLLKKQDAYAYYNRGQAYKGLKNYDSAQSDYLIATGISQGFWEAYHQLGELSLLKLDTNQALLYYSKAIDINILDLNSLVQKANIYMAQKKYDLAAKEVSNILETNPNHSLALYYKALIAEDNGQYADAVFYYDRVIAQDNYNQSAMYNRTMLFVKFENWEAAKQGFGLLTGMDSNNLNYLEKLAEMELNLGQADRAVQLLNKHKNRKQLSQQAIGLYFIGLIKMGKIKEADEYKKLNYNILQKMTLFVNAELELLYKKGDYPKCLSQSNNAFILDSSNCIAKMFKILSYAYLKNMKGELLQTLLELEPCLGDDSEYWYQLALASKGQDVSKIYYQNALKHGHFPLSDHQSLLN
jgi:tetratricopeptide (TPR) repeat protein